MAGFVFCKRSKCCRYEIWCSDYVYLLSPFHSTYTSKKPASAAAAQRNIDIAVYRDDPPLADAGIGALVALELEEGAEDDGDDVWLDEAFNFRAPGYVHEMSAPKKFLADGGGSALM